MIKFTFSVIFATFVFSFGTNPAAETTAVDWPAVCNKLSEMKGVFADAMTEVGGLVKNSTAEPILAKLVALVQTLFSNLDKSTEAETLTAGEAKTLYEEHSEKCAELKKDIIAEVEKTAPEDAKKIEKVFQTAREKCEPMRKELQGLLSNSDLADMS